MNERTQINHEVVNDQETEINLLQSADINTTQINTAVEIGIENNSTQINQQIEGQSLSQTTQINSQVTESGVAVSADMTQLNRTAQGELATIPNGTELPGSYVVESVFSTQSGEANLYLCSKENHKYIVKVYRRTSALKPEVGEALKALRSEHVARLYETGEWQGMPYEIIPYYQYGSLQGKTYGLDELRSNIIPSLNEGLKALHELDIIHKDLKPANIMLCDDQKSVAIIDFGISSIREGGNTVVVTRTGMTPEYSAPETFRNIFLAESDYYSLGVTIYELFCGHTPYSGSNREAIEKYVAVQKIPFPQDFPEELKELVESLTYNDITNRKDKLNPNRRWTYDEVAKWCRGEQVAVPGVEEVNYSATDAIPPITFQYNQYSTIGSLVDALGQDWINGKKRLYRSFLTQKFAVFNTDYASICQDAEDVIKQNKNADQDVEFFRVLYRLCPDLSSFHWKNVHYSNMRELGLEWLKGLRESDTQILSSMAETLEVGLFSLREGLVAKEKTEWAQHIKAIEEKYRLAVAQGDDLGQKQQMYVMAYLYAKTVELVTSVGSFYSLAELIKYIQQKMVEGDRAIEDIASELMSTKCDSDFLSINSQDAAPEFYGWLFAQGKGGIFQG